MRSPEAKSKVKFVTRFQRLATSSLLAAACAALTPMALAAQLDSDARTAIPHDVQQIIVIDYRAMQNSPAAMDLKARILPPELKQLERGDGPLVRAPITNTLRAGLAFQRGRVVEARELLRVSWEACRRLGVDIAAGCIALQHSRISDGIEGARALESARSMLRAEGMVDPDSCAEFYATGFSGRSVVDTDPRKHSR